jgi:hypothetical protein
MGEVWLRLGGGEDACDRGAASLVVGGAAWSNRPHVNSRGPFSEPKCRSGIDPAMRISA